MSISDLQGVTFRPISTWPGTLTRSRRNAPFRADWYLTMEQLGRELRMLQARHVVVELDLTETDFRNDGKPRAQARAGHPGIIVSFDSQYGPLRYAVDTYLTWQDNLRAVALAMEALRKVDRYGVTKRGEQYAGWRALEAETGNGVDLASQGHRIIDEHGGLREALRATHPDAGGDPDDFRAVIAARDAT